MSGIGVYTTQLFELLRGSFPNLGVRNAHYFSFADRPPHRADPGQQFARSRLGAAGALRRNLRASVRALHSQADLVHLCGADYSAALRLPRCIATVHDFGLRSPRSVTVLTPENVLVEVYSLVNLLESPRALRHCRTLVTISEATRDILARRTGLPSRVIHHWADRQRFFPRPAPASRRALGLPPDRPILLNVSAGTPNKNLPMLARLIRSLPPEYLLVKLGHPVRVTDGRVLNVGRVEEERYPLYFNSADAYVQVSLVEGFGRPLLEAISSGVPVVALAHPPAPEVLGSGGTLLPPGSSVSRLASAVRRVVEVSAERDRAIQRALARADAFSAASAAAQYREVYLDALRA